MFLTDVFFFVAPLGAKNETTKYTCTLIFCDVYKGDIKTPEYQKKCHILRGNIYICIYTFPRPIIFWVSILVFGVIYTFIEQEPFVCVINESSSKLANHCFEMSQMPLRWRFQQLLGGFR